MDSHYTTNGDLFYAMATNLVWQYLLDCWRLCNQALHHPQQVPPDAQILAKQAHHIIETACTNPKIAHLVPLQPIKTILQQPVPRLRWWVQRGKYTSTIASLLHTSMPSSTPMTFATSSAPSKQMTCDHRNWPKLYQRVGLLDYYGSLEW